MKIRILSDAISDLLLKFNSGTYLGAPNAAAREFDREGFVNDLESARKRNSTQFYIVLLILALGYIAVIGFACLNPNQIKIELLLGASGVITGGLGTILLQLARSWWRSDVILVLAKYESAETLRLLIRSLLTAENAPSIGRRSARAVAPNE